MRQGGLVPGADVPLDARPADRVRLASRRRGEATLARECAALLRGADPFADPELVLFLGGLPAQRFLGPGDAELWPRVWAARGLLYAWHPDAGPAVVAGLADRAWRVREMSAKVVAVRELGAAADALIPLCTDEVPRVRAAAARALGLVGEAEHASYLRDLRDDEEPEVRRQAHRALDRLSVRLERDLTGPDL